ncbi:MAG: hypothetical protein R3E95_12020 [Thiolinea sp.]
MQLPDLNGLTRHNALALGDACTAFDPLSGHGLFWSCSSALSAAAIVLSLREDGSEQRRALCQDFYRQRILGTFRHQAEIGREFYQLAGKTDAFWQERGHWQLDDDALQPTQPEALTGRAVLFRGAAIRAGRVVETTLLQVPGEHGPVAWFGEIALADTLQRYHAQRQAGQTVNAQTFHHLCGEGISVQAAQACWQWLQARQLLEEAPAWLGD